MGHAGFGRHCWRSLRWEAVWVSLLEGNGIKTTCPPHLPLRAGPVSNGEFVPAAETARDRAINELIRSSIDDAARRLGMDRRRFLQSAGAVAASLAAFELAGCAAAVSSTIVADDPSPTVGAAPSPRRRPRTPRPVSRRWPATVSSSSMCTPTT